MKLYVSTAGGWLNLEAEGLAIVPDINGCLKLTRHGKDIAFFKADRWNGYVYDDEKGQSQPPKEERYS